MQTAICLSIPLSIPVHSLFVFLFFFFSHRVLSFCSSTCLGYRTHPRQIVNRMLARLKSRNSSSVLLLGAFPPHQILHLPESPGRRKETSAHAQEGQQRLLNIQPNVPSISQLLPSLFLVFPSSGYSYYLADTEQHLQLDHWVHSETKQVPRLGRISYTDIF